MRVGSRVCSLRAPHVCQSAPTRVPVASAMRFPMGVVGSRLRPSYSDADGRAASGACRHRRRDGRERNRGDAIAECARAAAAMTSCLVLPASVTTVAAARWRGTIVAKQRRELGDRRRDQHDVGIGQFRAPSPASRRRAWSIDPEARRLHRDSPACGRRPTIRPTTPARFSASAHEAADETDADDGELWLCASWNGK